MVKNIAGYAYCAVAALSLLDQANPDQSASPTHYVEAGIPSIPSLIHFLVSRQFTYLDSSSGSSSSRPASPEPDPSELSISSPPVDGIRTSTSSSLSSSSMTGFNGRLNKAADTCYAWWVSGALALLGQDSLIDRAPARRFLVTRTQHIIGGFAKHPGGPPDLYHAYLGLAALATMAGGGSGGGEGKQGAEQETVKEQGQEKEVGLGRFDPMLCVGAEAARRIRRGREALLLAPPGGGGGGGGGGREEEYDDDGEDDGWEDSDPEEQARMLADFAELRRRAREFNRAMRTQGKDPFAEAVRIYACADDDDDDDVADEEAPGAQS